MAERKIDKIPPRTERYGEVMAMAARRAHPVLLVGVGGSGLNTLAAFNRSLASNPAMRPRMASDFFYLAVDTDMNALTHFQECIWHYANVERPPHVKCIHLFKGDSREFIRPYFRQKSAKDPTTARLRDNWWHSPDGTPYDGGRLEGITDSSPCNMIESYGQVWYHLHEIQDAIARIIDHAIESNGGDAEVVRNMEVFVVAGLAGGTGRGAWAPVALKVKEVFANRFGVNVQATGVFFDSSVLLQNVRLQSDEMRSCAINSLTGLSELSSWLPPAGTGLSIELPDMTAPDNSESDILRNTNSDGNEAFPPVDSAYLICGGHCRASLDSYRQYMEMAGIALSSILTNSAVRSSHLNRTDRYYSFSACRFAVDAWKLKVYFDYLARSVVLDNLRSSNENMEGVVDRYLARFPMAETVFGIGDIVPDRRGSLLKRAVFALLDQPRFEQDFSCLREMLREARPSDKELVQATVRQLIDSVSDEEIRDAVTTAVKSDPINGGCLPDLREELKSAFLEAYAGFGGIPHLGSVRRFAELLLERIRKAEDVSLREVRLTVPDKTEPLSPQEWIDGEINKFSNKSFADRLRFPGHLFIPEEVDILIKEKRSSSADKVPAGKVPAAVIFAAYPRLRAAIKAFFSPAIELAESAIRRCDEIMPLCAKAKEFLKHETAASVGATLSLEADPFRLVFATPDRVEDSLPDISLSTWHYNRLLKPIVKDEGELRTILWDGEGVMFSPERLKRFLLDAMTADEGGSDVLLKALTRVVRENVRADKSMIVRDFSLLKVLEHNRPYWNEWLNATADRDKKAYAAVSERIRMTLGVEVEEHGRHFELPPPEILVHTIAAEMSSSCLPCWIPRGTCREQIDGWAFMPMWQPSQSREIYEGAFRQVLERSTGCSRWNIVWSTEHEPLSPFAVVSFASESAPDGRPGGIEGRSHPFNLICSFDYWEDEQILKMLREAERPGGESVFERFCHQYSSRSRAYGYISPRFVRDPEISAKRWKPWTEKAESQK